MLVILMMLYQHHILPWPQRWINAVALANYQWYIYHKFAVLCAANNIIVCLLLLGYTLLKNMM